MRETVLDCEPDKLNELLAILNEFDDDCRLDRDNLHDEVGEECSDCFNGAFHKCEICSRWFCKEHFANHVCDVQLPESIADDGSMAVR